MGWTFTSVGRGCASEYFKKMLTYENENSKAEFVRGAFVGWKEYYAAVRTTIKETGKSFVWAFVAMVQWRPKDVYNFGYKDMDETCGPVIHRCPKSILNLLSPVEDIMESRNENGPFGWAKKWRQGCLDYANSFPTLKIGDIFQSREGNIYQVVRKRGKGTVVATFNTITGKASQTLWKVTRRWLKYCKPVVIAQAVKLAA